MQPKYRILKIVAVIYKLLAIVISVLGILAGIFLIVTPAPTIVGNQFVPGPPLVGQGIGLIIAALLAGIGLFAFAQLLQLLLDMAADMRTTAAYFRQRSTGTKRLNP